MTETLPSRRWHRVVWHALASALITLCASCSLYNVPHRLVPPGDPSLPTKTEPYALHYIEADDQGWFWQPQQADEALKLVESSIRRGDTLVLLFVHGWHHSAACYDGNAEAFKEVLGRLDEEVSQPMYQTARQILKGADKVQPLRVIGLYVGWRGRSLPGLLDYASFWGRKSAARRVGEGDFQEFLARLQGLYDGHVATARPAAGTKPFFGLVSIGHSFGGAVLLAATSHYFESELQRANPTTGFLRKGAPQATSAAGSAPRAGATLKGFGDLVVLVNPAVEAAAYERINVLSRGIAYDATQAPLLVTFSAENDGPRQRLFKPGRIAGEIFTSAARVEDPRERESLREPLGVYDFNGTGITHRLTPVGPQRLVSSRVPAGVDVMCPHESPGEFDWWRWEDQPVRPRTLFANESLNVREGIETQGERVVKFDFSGPLKLSGIELSPVHPITPWQPFIVASVDRQIIDGHNGVFSEPFMNFLLRYIGFAEAKRYLLSAIPR